MTKLLLSIHVLAVILAIGPVAVAASMFPAAVRRAYASGSVLTVAGSLHRICRVYAAFGIVVPVFGLATASSLGVLGNAWLIVSIALTAVAAGVLALLVLPRQERLLAAAPEPGGLARLAMYTGVFNLLWAVVTVLMVVRPGSTTRA
jgi:hypothetical protein